MGKHKRQKLKVPSDNLPPRQLQEAWDNYLDAEVGRQGARPRWEVLIDPKMMDVILFEQIQQLEIDMKTDRSDIYLQACKNVINRLPLLQRAPIRYYFGIDVPAPMTQEEIAKELGINQDNVSKRITAGMKSLKLYMRREVARLVKIELQK